MNNESSFDILTQESNPVQTVAPTNKEDNDMLRATEKITALYCRLSVEDTKDEKKNGKEDPSNSIQHQQVMLMQYAKANRLPNPTYFIDDGYSGVTYDRPGFQKMLSEIEAGNVGTVITKDLSRLGRNSALTGLYINYTFPQYGVRYIAVNDNYDSLYTEGNELAPFKNLFNEWYARDTSKKIRAVFKAKAERGERVGTSVPYGYKRDPEKKGHLLIDEVSSQVVRMIYDLCAAGNGPRYIAKILRDKQIVKPTIYRYRQEGKYGCITDTTDIYGWNDRTVAGILDNEVYLGTTVNCKSTVASYKDKRVIERPEMRVSG